MKFIKFCLFMLIFSMPAFAGSRDIDMSTFKTLSFDNQVKTIELVHDFLIEYEFQSLSDSTRSSKNKYSQYKKIWNFFITEAHAADDFKGIDSEKLCYYAGWVSIMRSGLCLHPGKLTSKNSQSFINKIKDKKTQVFIQRTSARYEKVKNKFSVKLTFNMKKNKFMFANKPKCNGKKDIICNSKIFGNLQGQNFCVSGNETHGINSSYLCNKALETLKGQGTRGKNAYNKVLKGIIDNSIGDKSTFNEFSNNLKAMYGMCLCSGDKTAKMKKDKVDPASKNVTNFKYSNRMFYSRTCYAILEQTQTIFDSLDQKDYACKSSKVGAAKEKQIIGWVNFLDKTHKVIDKELTASKFNLLTGKKVFKNISRKSSFKNDMSMFKKIRDEHFQEYVKAGICPMETKPTTELDSAKPIAKKPEDKSSTHFSLGPIEIIKNEILQPIVLVVSDIKGKPIDKPFKKAKFTDQKDIKKIENKFYAKLKATSYKLKVKHGKFEKPLDIPAPKVGCTVVITKSKEEGDPDTVDIILTTTPKKLAKAEFKSFREIKAILGEEKLKPKGDTGLQFTLPKEETKELVKIEGLLKGLSGKSFKFSCAQKNKIEQKVPKTIPEVKKGCSIKLAGAQDGANFKLSTEIILNGKKLEVAPAGDLTIKWYNSSTKVEEIDEPQESEGENSNMLGSTDAEPEGNEAMSENQKKLAKIEELDVSVENSPSLLIPITGSKMEVIVSVFSKENNCDQVANITVPAKQVYVPAFQGRGPKLQNPDPHGKSTGFELNGNN